MSAPGPEMGKRGGAHDQKEGGGLPRQLSAHDPRDLLERLRLVHEGKQRAAVGGVQVQHVHGATRQRRRQNAVLAHALAK
eukprot:604237-Prorocentrum_minimum.AAC.1